MKKPFAITLDPGSSLANHTGSWRNDRPVYVDRLPPCNNACPAGEDIQGWLYYAESGEYHRAWQELVRNNPLPALMGRVCYHPCENACNRGTLDEAVSIHAVERFLGDEARKQGWKFDIMTTSFFLSRRSLKPSASSGMPLWQDKLFIGLARSAADATEYFQIPTGRVVEVGTQVTI